MKDFTDRIPLNPGRRKITHENGTSEYVTVEMADNPTVIGTPLNRAAFMALQGFEAFHVTFNDDGSITETNALNEPLNTSFNTDGTIDEVFTNKDGLKIGIKTKFNPDGSISGNPINFTA